MLADLENNTGDEVFDRSLIHALGVTINQSKHVNIYPRRRVQEVLQRMKLDSVYRIDTPLALEIADRENIKAVLVLTISELNNTYLLSTSLMNTYSGETVRSRQVRAAGKEEVLDALNDLAINVRRDLGETMAKMLQRRLPLAKATTPSLDALKIYTDGAFAWGSSQWREAQNLWARAVELDSGFAWANACLGLAAEWLGSPEEANLYYERALGHLDRVTGRKRLWIIALSADQDHAIEAYRTYLREYPDDRDGWYNLGNVLRAEGRTEEAIEAYENSLSIDLNQTWPHVNIAVSLDGLGRYKEAANHFERVFELDPDQRKSWWGDVNRISGFVLVKMGDLSGARERFEVLLEGDGGGKANGLRSLALLNMYQGKHSEALELLNPALVINQRTQEPLSEFRNRLDLGKAYESPGSRNSGWDRNWHQREGGPLTGPGTWPSGRWMPGIYPVQGNGSVPGPKMDGPRESTNGRWNLCVESWPWQKANLPRL